MDTLSHIYRDDQGEFRVVIVCGALLIKLSFFASLHKYDCGRPNAIAPLVYVELNWEIDGITKALVRESDGVLLINKRYAVSETVDVD